MVGTLPSNAGDVGLISGRGAMIPPALQSKNIKRKQYRNKFNKRCKKKKKRSTKKILKKKKQNLQASNARVMGSIPGWRTKIPKAVWCSQKIFFKNSILQLFYPNASK